MQDGVQEFEPIQDHSNTGSVAAAKKEADGTSQHYCFGRAATLCNPASNPAVNPQTEPYYKRVVHEVHLGDEIHVFWI